MSLLDAAFEDYKIINTIIQEDGYGGIITTYSDGATIHGAMRFDSSIQARAAKASGVTSVYTFITRKQISLGYHQLLKRIRDNKLFRITSDGDDSFTPESAKLDMRLVTCEEWRLSDE